MNTNKILNKKTIKKIIWGFLFVIALVAFIVNALSKYKDENSYRYYKQGLKFLSENDYQNAYYNFSSARRGSIIYCPSKYRAAMVADTIYDKKSAEIMYKEVYKDCKNTLFEEPATYNLAKIYFEKGDLTRANNIFTRLIKEAKTQDYSVASSYFLGEIQQPKNRQNAKSYYLYYLEKSPTGTFSQKAIDNILSSKVILNSDEFYILAIALYKNGNYNKAKDLLQKIPLQKSWYYLALTLQKSGNMAEAKNILYEGLSKYSDSIAKDELYDAIDICANYISRDKKEAYKTLVNLLVPNTSAGGDYAMYKYVMYLPKTSRIDYYFRIYNLYPTGDFASNALGNLILINYKSQNYQKVLSLGHLHIKNYSHTLASPKVLLFMGKALRNQGDNNEAKEYFRKILTTYPDDYYALRAKAILSGKSNIWAISYKKHIKHTNHRIKFPISYLNIESKNISTIKFLIMVEDWFLIDNLFKDNDIVKSWLNYQFGNKTRSVVLARNFISKLDKKPAFSDEIMKLAYPIYYVDEIKQTLDKYEIDPYIILSIIKEESHFNKDAESIAGAKGLMQLMPSTAEFISKEMSIPYTKDSLETPQSNIDLGTAYFYYVLKNHSYKYLFAVAAYNAGHNAVKYWHEMLNYKDYDEFVEEIPYPETQTYIRKIFKSYWNYLNIYDTIS